VPASTFKIANSLIALETGAVANEDEVVPYGGGPQPIKAWERDMSMRDAIKVSNVPVYQEIARRIGPDRMREWLNRLGYGNGEIGDVVDRFWLQGPLKISPLEQTRFLAKLAKGELPASADNQRRVREITLLEQQNGYTLHGKTGSLTDFGWWVGWIERDGRLWTFALAMDLKSDQDNERRVPLGRELLRGLGVLL
jgi:beta-lactamase class D